MWIGIGNTSATVGEAVYRHPWQEMPKVPGFGRVGAAYLEKDSPGNGRQPTPGREQAVESPGTLQLEGNMEIYGCCLPLVHSTNICEAPSVCQTLSLTLRIQNSIASFTGLHSGWGNRFNQIN